MTSDTRPLSALRSEPRYTPDSTAPLATLRARGQHPDMFPALPGGTRDTGPQQRLPRIARVQERQRPARPYDAALFTWSDLLEQFIMLCGTCPPGRRSRFAEPAAASMPFAFETLRTSAYAAGWRLDRFARWACPACQRTPQYHAPYGVIHWDPDAAEAYLAGDRQGESWARAAAELDLIEDVALRAGNGRHRAGAR